jgi:DNA polymerase III epsilon subunit-like protein
MKKLVIDIETVGTPWEELDAYVREYLIKGLSDGDAEETRRAGGLSPFRGRIIAIGVINIDDGRSCAMYEVPGQTQLSIEKAGQRTYISGSEKQILEKFWEFFEGDSRFITFNGRQFDGPFLMIRSAINGIIPKRDLVGYRYGYHPNCDLREALNFFGTTNARQFKFNLDLACKVFGVETSKGEGLDGRSVETWYRAGRHREIADYCLREAEERAMRFRRQAELPLAPAGETLFMESVTQTSIALSESLDAPEPVPVITGTHQAVVLEKLVRPAEEEEEIPSGV